MERLYNLDSSSGKSFLVALSKSNNIKILNAFQSAERMFNLSQ